MKAVVFHGVGDRLDNVPEPRIQQQTDAIVRLSVSAICGTDLHMIRGPQSATGRSGGHSVHHFVRLLLLLPGRLLRAMRQRTCRKG